MALPRDTGNGWIGIDLDGTLAEYTTFKGTDHIGEPIEPMVRRVRKWIREGRDVRLFTARRPSAVIRRWMKEHLGKVLPITNIKDPGMQFLLDDRAVGVERNTGRIFSDENMDQVWEK